MADEFQAGVCGESWWNYSTKSIFGNSSLCASSIHYPIGHDFAWPISDLLDMKAKSSDDSNCSDDSMVLQELPKHHLPIDLFMSSSTANLSTDYTLQMLEIDLSSSPSSSTPDWNQSLHDKLVDINSSLNYRQEKELDCPELKRNFSSISEYSSSNSFKQTYQDFTSGLQPLNTVTYSSDLLQTLLENDIPQQPQQSLFANNQPINYAPSTNYRQNLNDFVPSLPTATSPWNTTATTLSEIRASLPNITSKPNIDEIRQSTSSSHTKNSGNEPVYKRPRIETPSPLPTFKVRKEKMGDRITALQQLVSPFGKTDTASVLQEAIEYIKFLHDQVNGLSTPYMINGSPTQRQQEQEGLKQDLRSRGLCLIPVSSTFQAAAETTMEFWTPALGGTLIDQPKN